jgi:hypothetical protein
MNDILNINLQTHALQKVDIVVCKVFVEGQVRSAGSPPDSGVGLSGSNIQITHINISVTVLCNMDDFTYSNTCIGDDVLLPDDSILQKAVQEVHRRRVLVNHFDYNVHYFGQNRNACLTIAREGVTQRYNRHNDVHIMLYQSISDAKSRDAVSEE